MINKTTFASKIQEMALLLGMEIDDKWMLAMYQHITDYFTDEEFSNACHKIMITEELYGRLPTVKHFLKYSSSFLTKDDLRTQRKTEFLNKVCDYLQLDYASSYDREVLYDGMSELEYRTLQSAGGMSELWRRVHDYDYPTNISKIRKELSEFYEDNFTAESVTHKIALTNERAGQQSLGSAMGKLLEKLQ